MDKILISVVGSGVVGQATGKGFLAHGYDVQFIDINEDRVEELKKQGLAAFTPVQLEKIGDESEVTVFTVSTPTEDKQINLSYLESAAEDLGKRLVNKERYHLVVVRSTVVPGTTEDMIVPIIEKVSGKRAGVDFGACMNPEYLREVSAEEDFAKPWIITVGELDKKSGDKLMKLYKKYECPKYRLGLKEAETQKYVHNLFNAVKIAFFNEMRETCRKDEIDAEKIFPLVAKSAEGMWNAKYGIRDLGPFDGMCLPKDTQAFLDWAKKHGWEMPILETVIEENNRLTNDLLPVEKDEMAAPKKFKERVRL